MAGTATPGESSDNPVPINVTAMVDIIFCLCIFFMCSFHFRQLEGKLESWLPKDRGLNATPVKKVQIEEIRIFVQFNPNAVDASNAVIRKVGPAVVASDDQMRATINARRSDLVKQGVSEFPVIIDAEPKVPWKDVVNVLDICRREKFERVEFAGPH